MNNSTFKMKPIKLAILLAGIGMAPASYAADLVAIEGQWSPDGGTTQILMWGFARDTGQICGSLQTWNVGPQLRDTDLEANGDLIINLRNCLSKPVSIIIPGQPATFTPVRSGNRVTAFTIEAPSDAGVSTTTYTWSGVKPGTYLYQSGSHPAKQVQMGLYGALTIGSYPDTNPDDVTLLYSEIDPALHNPPAAATPLGYKPEYYLVNGSATPTTISTGGVNLLPTVLRMLNAGLDFHVPALNSGYMTLVAEDGNPYPFTRQQYSVNLAAGKTIDALLQPDAVSNVIYDRRGNGMVARLSVGEDTILPVISLQGANPASVEVGYSYTDAGATATDNIDSTVTVNTNGLPVDTTTAGTSHTITYDAVDAAGNAALQVTRMVNVTADVTLPVITLNGSNPMAVELGTAYAEPGATATDNVDGTVAVSITGTVNPIAEGSYTITYTATDTATVPNTATVTRTVNVIAADNIAPVITLNGSNPMAVELGTAYAEPGATATDNVDGTVAVSITGTVNPIAEGSYTITYMATDTATNIATVTRTVVVADTIAPEITVLGTDPVDITAGDTYADVGATAMDNGSAVTVITDNPVNPAIANTYTVTYTATDTATVPNTATATRTVNVNAIVVPPTAVADTYGTDEDVALTVAASGVLANDGTGLNAILVSGPSSGTLNLAADGSFDYSPNGDFNGTDSFSYMANDGISNSNVATVTITMTAVNDAPVAVADTPTVFWKTEENFIDLTDNDSDVDNDLKVGGNVSANRITITTGQKTSRRGKVEVMDNGVLYTSRRKRFRGTDTFKYTVTDLSGAVSNEVTVKVNVIKGQ